MLLQKLWFTFLSGVVPKQPMRKITLTMNKLTIFGWYEGGSFTLVHKSEKVLANSQQCYDNLILTTNKTYNFREADLQEAY